MPWWQRLIRYGLVGASGVVVSTLVLEGTWPLLHQWGSVPFALSTETAIITNFLLNSYFTFRQAPAWMSLVKYNAVSIVGGLAQVGISGYLEQRGIYHLWAYWAGIPFNTGIGFLLSVLWVFRASRSSSPEDQSDVNPAASLRA